MPDLDRVLHRLRNHNGVQHVLVLGRDGLLIHHLGEAGLDLDTATAMIPEIASACGALGAASGRGELSTAVMEFAYGVAIVVSLSADLLLALLVEPGIGFAPLLAEVRQQRDQLASLL